MKEISYIGASVGVVSALSKDDIIFIISIIITVLNLVIGYLNSKKERSNNG